MAVTGDVELELLHDGTGYSSVLRRTIAGAQTELPTLRQRADIDEEALRATISTDAYGTLLGQQLFPDGELTREFKAFHEQMTAGGELRVRLSIDRGALELHRIHWEKLRLPGGKSPLLQSEKVLFSRFLHSQQGRAAALRAQDTLRSLVFISNPPDLPNRTNGRLPPVALGAVDVAREQQRARLALGTTCDVFASSPLPTGPAASLDALIETMGDSYDVLYLACHGAARDDRFSARVFLEDPTTRHMTTVAVDELANRFAAIADLPTVVVLASCESAGSIGDDDGLASLGPKLIEAGVLAVVAMQGRVGVETASTFAQRLFYELSADGRIDRAVAVARNQVSVSHNDWWMPVLFSRLRAGAIWYQAGFGGANSNAPFASLCASVQTSSDPPLVPVIGPGVLEGLIGSVEGFTAAYARTHWGSVPVSWSDLPRLTQYRITTEGHGPVNLEILRLLRSRAVAQTGVSNDGTLAQVLERAWRARAAADPFEPHKFLASLDVPIFITTSIDDSLAHALRDAKKDPIVEVFRWRPNVDLGARNAVRVSEFEKTPDRPARELDPKRPLVFHLFGHIRDPNSLVLSEDDFFDYLMESQKKGAIPEVVSTAWRMKPLLFMGFRLEDWRFRLCFEACVVPGECRTRTGVLSPPR